MNDLNKKKYKKSFSKNLWIIVFMVLLMIVLVMYSITIGRYPITWNDLCIQLFTRQNLDSDLSIILWDIRIPRVIAAILTGGALALAGASYQAIFKNPMVSPDILGVSSGAGLGASLGIFFSLPIWGIQIMAFILGLIAVALAFFIAKVINRNYESILMLVLSGIIRSEERRVG